MNLQCANCGYVTPDWKIEYDEPDGFYGYGYKDCPQCGELDWEELPEKMSDSKPFSAQRTT